MGTATREKLEYFIAAFDSLLKNGKNPKEAILQVAEDYAYVFHNIKPKEQTVEVLQKALFESIKLQGHYAKLLNQYDGGKRMEFKTIEEWLINVNKFKF